MIIRQEQFAALAAGWERSRRTAFLLRLRREFPAQCEAIPDRSLEKQIEDGCKAANALAITDSDHIYRFLRLRYLALSVRERPAAQELMVRVLTDSSIDAGRRIQFVETSILLTQPPPARFDWS